MYRYITTNALHQSKSVGRLRDNQNILNLHHNEKPARPVRHNNHHRANMTTIETDLCKNINEIYKEKLGMAQTPNRANLECKSKLIQKHGSRIDENRNMIAAGKPTPLKVNNFESPQSTNKTLERCVTAPVLQTVNQVEQREENEAQELPAHKPPKIP